MLQEQDRDVVSGQILTLDQSLSQLERIETTLARELGMVRAKIEDLRRQRATLESRIAAVWALPNEILSYIFQLGVMDEEKAEIESEVKVDEEGPTEKVGFQILVSQVCRMFREVAIGTPCLWTQIHILDLAPPRIDFVRTCVERSGCSKLDVMVDSDDPRLGHEPEPIETLMTILVPHIHRFQRFTVRLRGFQSLYRIMQVLDRPAPQLETLELSDIDYENAFDEDDPFSPTELREPLVLFGGVTPKLESVSLDGAHVAWKSCDFTDLVELHLGYHTRDVRPSFDEFKAIIDASPALRRLDLRGSAPLLSDDPAETSLYAPLLMDRLEDMHISDIPSDYATTLISLLRAPHLKSLSLTDLDTNDYSVFFRCIMGPPVLFPCLNTLKLASIEVADDAFESLLRAFPKVTHLTLYFNQMPITWLTYLEPNPEHEIICPKLESLKCVSASTSDIKKVLEKRREAGFPIARLQIDKETENWGTKGCMKWIRENTTVEIIEPSEHGTDDEAELGTESEWATDDDGEGFPYFSMEGFSDEEVDDEDEEDYEDNSEMEVDGTDGSGAEE